MRDEQITFTAKVWRYGGKATWYFVTVPPSDASLIRFIYGGTRGFNSVRVQATVRATTWKTSIFPDKATESFLLPLKKEVRKLEAIEEDQEIEVKLEIESGLEGF